MPSSTRVTQEGARRLLPSISTRHSRQPPTGVRPSRWQRLGMAIPFSVATSQI